ncbi:MAG: glutamate-1-semialdehyde 2,1-aminomutase [Thiotrichales bacterium]
MSRYEKSLALRERFNATIPGGAHTYAKGDDQFPEFAAPYISHGEGCRVWDVDGNEYVEYGLGLRSVGLGHAYPEVSQAVIEQLAKGANFCRPAVIELEAAEQFLEMIPGAEMVKFAKNGSDATTAAVKLARAYTGRDKVGVCQDHPFFSVDDWFIGTTRINAGIPKAITALNASFKYNDLESVDALFQQNPGEIACLILEAERDRPPAPGYLQGLKDRCEAEGALLIFDEIVTGFRWHNGGAQTLHGVTPHLSTWGKAMGNGFAIAALAGQREFMDRGGIYHEHERVFLLSTTYGAETSALAAVKATMQIYQHEDVIAHLYRMGAMLREGVEDLIEKYDLQGRFKTYGKDCSLFFGTNDPEGNPSQAYRTLFLQEMLKRGVLAPSFLVCYSHQERDIEITLNAVDESLAIYQKAIANGYEHYLEGRPVAPVYRKKNFPDRTY